MKHHTLPGTALLTFALLLAAPAVAEEPQITIENLDAIVAENRLEPDGAPARVVATTRAGDSELQVLVMSKIRLHHHEEEDHVVYVARGSGTARLETVAGEIDVHPVTPGDILNLPRGLKHAFDATGDEDLVLLVVATAGWKPLEDTQFHE